MTHFGRRDDDSLWSQLTVVYNSACLRGLEEMQNLTQEFHKQHFYCDLLVAKEYSLALGDCNVLFLLN